MNTDLIKQYISLIIFFVLNIQQNEVQAMSAEERKQMREKVIEMFSHGYRNYMDHAFPADELMPLSCKGRHRGTTPSRGDIDDLLGNFSLTLIDTLDTLAVLGLWRDFEEGVRLVIEHVTFDRDIVVSTFETNIRVLGGLLGGHVMAVQAKLKHKAVPWYNDELLEMAREIGTRLLPAFNTTTGIPYPRVNLLHGVKAEMSRAGHERDTCTACAGTMILEFAALSRLTGDPIYEEKAHKAMDKIWTARHRHSNLVGTVINIHNGDWVRRDSGIGAGIDSYYEYLLKAYILLGEDTYLDRFNTHYESIMKYINQGPLMVDVHMHKPLTNSRNFMDALLAFWPGLQVLKGDIKPAVELHEMLYQVTQRHNFLPEAFTTDFRVHWGQHPLRPEFLESTYFIYKATGDPHYLDVGKTVLDNLEKHARVPCGFAAIKDVTKGTHEDQMDSYVLAETFKYLFLLFSDKEDIFIDMDNFIFTTEAHLLPLSLSMQDRINITKGPPRVLLEDEDFEFERSCPNTNHLYRNNVNYAADLRSPLKNMVDNLCPKPRGVRRNSNRLKASDFVAGNKDQLALLNKMGIKIITMSDGRVQLLHTASEAASSDDAEDGMQFMQEMIEFSKAQQTEVQQDPMILQLLSPPHYGKVVYNAGPAQFGPDLKKMDGIQGNVLIGDNIKGCKPLLNEADVLDKIVIVERGECMFIDKARILEAAGARGGIILDNNEGSTSETSPLFAMSGDGKDDIHIPLVFLFSNQGKQLLEAIIENPQLVVFMGAKQISADDALKGIIKQEQKKYEKISKTDDLKEMDFITFKTPDGLPIFHITRDQDNRVHINMEKATIEQRMKKRMGETLEQIVSLLQEKLNVAQTGITEQSHYLYDLGKLMEASMNEHTTDEQFQKVIRGVLERNDLSDIADDQKSTLHKNMDAILNTYIETQISKVVDEAKEYVDKVAREDKAKATREDATKDEDSTNLNPTDDTNLKREDSDGQTHYATDEELNEQDERGSVRHKIDLTKENIIKKAPSWMGLKPGEVLVARDGSMYASSGYDEEGLIEEPSQEGFEVQEMYLVNEGTDNEGETSFDFEEESEPAEGENFKINYSQARDRVLNKEATGNNKRTDENNNVKANEENIVDNKDEL